MMIKEIFCAAASLCIAIPALAQSFTLKSPDLGGQFDSLFISNTFGCKGGNRSPALQWVNAPEGTLSYAVTMYDADAPTGSGWWHWVLFDLPATAKELKQGAGSTTQSLLPAGCIQSQTDFGMPGYGGPCPPQHSRAHGYRITVYALSVATLGLDKTATPALVGFMLHQKAIAQASLIVYAKR